MKEKRQNLNRTKLNIFPSDRYLVFSLLLGLLKLMYSQSICILLLHLNTNLADPKGPSGRRAYVKEWNIFTGYWSVAWSRLQWYCSCPSWSMSIIPATQFYMDVGPTTVPWLSIINKSSMQSVNYASVIRSSNEDYFKRTMHEFDILGYKYTFDWNDIAEWQFRTVFRFALFVLCFNIHQLCFGAIMSNSECLKIRVDLNTDGFRLDCWFFLYFISLCKIVYQAGTIHT